MSAVCLRLMSACCVFSAALSGKESYGVEWRDAGGSITIRCRSPKPQQMSMTLLRGLAQDSTVLHSDDSGKQTVATEFEGRVRTNGTSLNLDIFIANLTSNDTGPYWCKYGSFNWQSSDFMETRGTGSVLLVVTEDKQCDALDKNLVLVSVGISAAVLCGIVLFLVTWIIKAKTPARGGRKPGHSVTNEVYEDMRGTVRR